MVLTARTEPMAKMVQMDLTAKMALAVWME